MTEPSKVFLEPGDKPGQNPPPGYIASYHKSDGPYYTDDGGIETKILTEKVVALLSPVVSGPKTASVGDAVAFTIDNYDSENTYTAMFDGVSVDVVGSSINFNVPAVYSEGAKCLVIQAGRSGYNDVTGVFTIEIIPDEILGIYADAETAFSLMTPGSKTYEYDFQTWSVGAPTGGPVFSGAGDKVFVGDFQTGHIHAGALATPWDLSTISSLGSTDTGAGADTLRSFVFNLAGDKLYLSSAGVIIEIALDTPWGLSTMGTSVSLDTGKFLVCGLALDSIGDLWCIDPDKKNLVWIPLSGTTNISEVDIADIKDYTIPGNINSPMYLAGVLLNFQTVFLGDHFGAVHELRIPYHFKKFELIGSYAFPSMAIPGGTVSIDQGKFFCISPGDTKIQEYHFEVDLIVDNPNPASWPYGRAGFGLKFVEYMETTVLVTGVSLEVTVEGPPAVRITGDSTTSVLVFTFTNQVDPRAIVTGSGELAQVDSITLVEEQELEIIDIQVDALLDPGATPAGGDRYIIMDSSNLHTNFGVLTGLADGDIVQYNGTGGIFEVSLDASTTPYAYAYVSSSGAHWEWDSTTWAARTDSGLKDAGVGVAYKHSATLTQALPTVPEEAYLAASMFAGTALITGMIEVGVDSISDFEAGALISFKQISKTANLEPSQKITAGVKCLVGGNGDTEFKEMTIHGYTGT